MSSFVNGHVGILRKPNLQDWNHLYLRSNNNAVVQLWQSRRELDTSLLKRGLNGGSQSASDGEIYFAVPALNY